MAVERVIIEITGDTTKIQSTISELEKLGKVDRANSDSFKRTNKQFNDDLAKTKNNLGGFGDQLNSLKQQVIGAFAVSSLIAFGKEAVATAAKIEGIGNSLKFITGSSANAEKTMAYLRELSNRLGLEFESTAQAFKLFAGATTQAGMTLGQTKSIFESVSKAVTTMGLSADDANGVFLALSQIMSKGKVSAEELRGQIGERLPGAFTIAAKSIGVTEQQLNKMLEQGEILSKDFLPKFAKQLEKDLGGGAENAANSTQAALNRISNAYSSFKDWFGSTIVAPIVQGTAKMIKAMQDVTPQSKASAMAQADLNAEYAKFEKTINDLEFSELKYIKAQELIMKAKDDEKKAIKDQKQAYSDLEEYMLTYYSERERGIFNTIRSQQGEEAFLTRLTVTGDKRVRNLVQEIRLQGEYANGYADLIPKMEEYQKGLIQENTVTDANIEKKEKKSKAAEKELNEYEKLVKIAKDTEEALQVLYTTGAVANTPLEIKLRSVLSTIEMINDRVEMAKNGMQEMQLTQGSERGGSLKPYLEAIKLGSQGQFDESGKNILIKGEIGVVEKIIDGKKQLVYDYEQWLTEYMLQQAKNRNQSISDTNAEFDKIESDRKAQFLRDEEEKKKQIRQIELDAAMQVINIGLDYAYQAKQREYDYELQLLDNMLANKKITEEEYNRRKKEIQQKDAESQKEYSIFKATLDTANAILNALATGGTAAPALAIAAGVVGAAQIAAIAATPLPQYAEGTEFVALGKNKKGVDTIPALLNEGEAVITTEQNAMYPGMAKAWNDGKLDEHIYKKWVLPELIMNKSFEQQKQRSFAENVAKSIQLNQDFGSIESKLKRIDETEKQVGAMIVGAIKESKKQNIW